jgi:hypothetical protein
LKGRLLDQIAPIIKALAALLWPLISLVVVVIFRSEIKVAMHRISKAEIFGQKIELREELAELKASVAATAVEIDALPKENRRVDGIEQDAMLNASVEALLKQATSDPKLALMSLSAELEKQARLALASRGLLQKRHAVSIGEALKELIEYGFPPNLIESLRLFSDVRNRIVHGLTATNDDTLSALDLGISLLKALNALPNEVNIVYHPGVDIFADSACTKLIDDAKGVIVETTSPGGVLTTFHIFPTKKHHFKKGKKVAWEWNAEAVWPDTWYKDPDTGAIREAWNWSAEFVGRHLDDI